MGATTTTVEPQILWIATVVSRQCYGLFYGTLSDIVRLILSPLHTWSTYHHSYCVDARSLLS